ncbi:MAG: DNA mismatch repair endonuclease MutL [Bacillota bacterium]
MPRIIVLDEVTANQIAAGEVVERPASVVKELLENSFDAGASRIAVEIQGGGLDRIKVTDNGCGMDETDSVTALQRHATSKISSVDDIMSIRSLGFRGEALPSIAAVSKMVLITRPPDTDSGTRLEVQGGRLMSVSPAGCPPGTGITVEDLFFNTPARLKYMKSKSTESGQIADIVSRLALARPDVRIRLDNEGRTMFHSAGTGNWLDALAAVYGAETARDMLLLEGREGETTVRGLICPPSFSRSTKRHITVIINGRYVRNYLLNTAIIEGYGTLLPQGRFPLAMISVDLDPELLDVNVHPSKTVIRISGESALFNLVKRTVMATLRTDRVIPGVIPSSHYPAPEDCPPSPVVSEAPVNEYRGKLQSPPVPAPVQNYRFIASQEMAPELPREKQLPGKNYLFASRDSLLDSIYPIGFLPPTYILAGSESGLLIIDHHAAHERVMYEKFLKLLSRDKIDVQILLVPSVVQLSPKDYQIAEENLDYFTNLGINVRSFGSCSLVVGEIPAGMSQSWVEDIIRDLLEYIVESGKSAQREDLIKKLASSAACKAAIKSGTKSTLEEARSLIEDLKRTEIPYTCPHGRPTMINISDQELKNRFKRT